MKDNDTTDGKISTVEPDLSVMLGSVRLANPVMTASGTCGYSFELNDFVPVRELGAFVTKSITLKPRKGNPPPRTVETASGMLNSIGLANIGLERFCSENIPQVEQLDIPIIVNVAEKSVERYVEVAGRLSEYSQVSGLELNVSCPNVKEGGIEIGSNPSEIAKLVTAVRKKCPQLLLIVKLTPNVTDITLPAKAAIEAGADCLSLVNTLTGMAIDVESRKPLLASVRGGLSGPAIKPIALHMVHEVYQKVARSNGIPIIGIGGISSASDALEFIIAGATAVQIGTAVFVDPGCMTGAIEGIRQYLIRHNIPSVRELVGTLAV
ncbi:MAG: dihydroorotate dehydrogenase [Planctomycetes bacterium]|nr:dihydroorotate dehydrogenase [Planctomycetota bacterium]